MTRSEADNSQLNRSVDFFAGPLLPHSPVKCMKLFLNSYEKTKNITDNILFVKYIFVTKLHIYLQDSFYYSTYI